MKNFLIVFVLVVIAANVYGFLFSDDGRSQANSRESTLEQTRSDETQQVRESDEVTTEVSLEQGEKIFSNNCAACHGKNGEGSIGPEFAGNDNLADSAFIVGRILQGQGSMPAFGNRFSDQEVADVTSFIRSSWGNEFGSVTTEDVATRR